MELLSDIARLNIKQDSYNSMLACEIINRIQETKSGNRYNTKNKKKHTKTYQNKVK